MSNNTIQNNGAVNARYEVPDELMLPGMSKAVRPDVAAVVHDNCHVENVARFFNAPYRNAGTLCLLTLDDFKKLVEEAPFPSSVFVSRDNVVAVFNMEGWQDDTARFPLVYTPEWNDWKHGDGRSFKQEDFCDFLEDHMKEIVQPCGAELLDMVANFRQMTRVEYGSSYRGADGQIVLEYKENKAGAGGRDMALPAEFVLHLPVIKGAELITTYEVKARLRVRVDNDTHKLTLQYKLVRPDIPQDNAIADMVEHLRDELPGSSVYAGQIEATPAKFLC